MHIQLNIYWTFDWTFIDLWAEVRDWFLRPVCRLRAASRQIWPISHKNWKAYFDHCWAFRDHWFILIPLGVKRLCVLSCGYGTVLVELRQPWSADVFLCRKKLRLTDDWQLKWKVIETLKDTTKSQWVMNDCINLFFMLYLFTRLSKYGSVVAKNTFQRRLKHQTVCLCSSTCNPIM